MLKFFLSQLRRLGNAADTCLAEPDILLHPSIRTMDERERADLPMWAGHDAGTARCA